MPEIDTSVAPATVIVKDQQGREFEIGADQVQGALDKGWSVQSAQGRIESVARQAHEASAGGVRGAVGAFGASALSGLTLGASDIAIGAIGGEDARSELSRLRRVNPIASVTGQVTGSLLPVLPGAAGGALLRASPAGIASRVGTRIAEAGAEAGALKQAATAAAGAATEGALQNAGSYLSEVAIGDRELAADGFIGAMGQGALYGGIAGGSLQLAGSGLTAARRLLPKEAVTREAVERVEQEAVQTIGGALEVDSRAVERAARARLAQLREEAAALDLKTAQDLSEIKVQKARELAELDMRAATAKTETAEARAARAKAGPQRKPRKAFEGDGAPVEGGGPVTEAPVAPEPVAPSAPAPQPGASAAAEETLPTPTPGASPAFGAEDYDPFADIPPMKPKAAPEPALSVGGGADDYDPFANVPPLKPKAKAAPVVVDEIGDDLSFAGRLPEAYGGKPPAHVQEWIDKHPDYVKWQNSVKGRLSPQQQEAVLAYTDSFAFEPANKALRAGEKLPDDLASVVDNLDSAMAGGGLPKDMTLVRGVNSGPGIAHYKSFKVGDEFTDQAFLSTSASPNYAAKDRVLISIQAPKGTKALPAFAGVDTAYETEVLLNRGLKYRVVGREESKVGKIDQVRLKLEVVPDTGATTTRTAAAPVSPAADSLLSKLEATKAGLDAGTSLADLSSAKRETFIEDALNARIAETSPEARRILGHLSELEDARNQMARWIDKYKGGKVKAFEYAEGMRPTSGYQSVVTEGNATVPRGRSFEFRGTDAERAAADARTLSKVSAEDIMAADEAVAASAARRNAKATAHDIVNASEREAAVGASNLDEQIGHALRARPEGGADVFADDLDDTVASIGRYEQKEADLADALGADAPPQVAERARGYREAQSRQSAALDQHTVDAVADADKAAATIGLGEVPGKPGLRALAQKAADAGSFLEALQMLGIPVPDASSIPIVGPLASAYLKARLASKVFRRMGGKLPASAETVIAGKSSAIQQRVTTAIDKALEIGGKAVTVAAPKSGGIAAVLGHRLFDDGEPGDRAPAPKKGDMLEMYRARADELQRAMQPGAIREALRKRIRTSDPALFEAIVAAEERKLKLLYDEMPRPSSPPGLLDGGRQYIPNMAGLSRFARAVQAVDDPASVIEQAATGAPVSPEAARAVRTVYPRLLDEARKRLIERSAHLDKPMSLPHKVALSRLLDMALDRSMEPRYAAWLQQGHAAPPPPSQPAPQMGQPTIAADINLGSRVDPFAEGV